MKSLIVYYSHSGNTHKIAELISDKTGGDLFEILPKQAYPKEYKSVVEQAKKEIKAGFMPELISLPDNLDEYDTVFVGTPNWWSTLAPPVASFLSGCDLSGKTIVPFCTHGGGGQARVLKDIIKLCPASEALTGFDVYGDGGRDAEIKVTEWLKSIGIEYNE